MQPDPANAEILSALEMVISEQRQAAESLSTIGSNPTKFPTPEIDPRLIEKTLRQLARYREELKQDRDLPPALEAKPRAIDRFQIVRELGRGGCGVVFLAHDPELNRFIALKVPHPAVLVLPELQRRFMIEARAAACLEHPNIIRVYEVGSTGPISWIASEYCAGITLQLYLERRQTYLAPGAAAQVIRQLALAMDEAHQHGILHRDLKPANVLLEGDFGDPTLAKSRELPPLEDCQPKLTDFGLAKILTEAQEVTQTHLPMGTPAYMSPEQVAGEANLVSNTSDVYSLGIILYELLAGVPAFRGSTRTETWRQILQEDPKPISLYRADVPRDLQAIVRRATEKKPSDRYQSAAELAADLQRFLLGEPTLARPLGVLPRSIRWLRRHPTAGGIISVVAVSLFLLFAGGYWHLHKIEEELRINRELRATGELQLEELRHTAYLRNLQLAHAGLAEAKLGSALSTLEAAIPQAGEPDRRDFIWHNLWNRCHHEFWRLKQNNTVSALAFSPDGKLLASGEHHSRITITEADTGIVLHSLSGHRGNINALAFYGQQLLSAADDGKVMVWDPQTGERLAELECHQGDILCLAVHPSKPWIATGGVDTVLRLWDLESKTLLKEFQGENYWLRGVGFSPDGKSLLSTGHEECLRCWDLDSGQLKWISEKFNGKLHALAVYPEAGTVFVGGQTGKIYECRLSDGELTDWFSSQLTWIRGLAYNSKTGYLAICGNWGRVCIWKADRSAFDLPEFDFPAHTDPVWSIAFAPNGDFFATGSTDKFLKVWHTDTDRKDGYRVWEIRNLSSFRDIQVNFATGMVLVVGSEGWAAVNLREFGSSVITLHPLRLDDACIDPRIQMAAIARIKQPLALLSGFDEKEQKFTPLGNASQAEDVMAWSKDGTKLGVLSGRRNLRIMNVTENNSYEEYLTPQASEPRSLALAPDAHYAALHYNSPREVQLLDLQSRNILWTTPSIKVAPVFSPDGNLLAAGSSEETVKIFSLREGREIANFAGKSNEIAILAFSADSRMLAVAHRNSIIQFWDIRTGTRVCEIPTAFGTPYAIFFSSDQRQMLVAVEHRGKHKLCYYADFRKPYPH